MTLQCLLSIHFATQPDLDIIEPDELEIMASLAFFSMSPLHDICTVGVSFLGRCSTHFNSGRNLNRASVRSNGTQRQATTTTSPTYIYLTRLRGANWHKHGKLTYASDMPLICCS